MSILNVLILVPRVAEHLAQLLVLRMQLVVGHVGMPLVVVEAVVLCRLVILAWQWLLLLLLLLLGVRVRWNRRHGASSEHL
jgi:hypothetical protein